VCGALNERYLKNNDMGVNFKVSLGDVYCTLEEEIKVVQKMIDEEKDAVMQNELRLLKGSLTDALLKARQLADIKLEQARQAAINITGKR
jgi:uncharacterized Zn finger protein (UPF0148 family)